LAALPVKQVRRLAGVWLGFKTSFTPLGATVRGGGFLQAGRLFHYFGVRCSMFDVF